MLHGHVRLRSPLSRSQLTPACKKTEAGHIGNLGRGNDAKEEGSRVRRNDLDMHTRKSWRASVPACSQTRPSCHIGQGTTWDLP